MVNVKMYDRVMLKDGRTASIVEIYPEAYIVDVDLGGDWETKTISKSDVVRVLD